MKGKKDKIMLDFSLFSKGLWTVALVVTIVLFSIPIVKLFGREGTWARAGTTLIWFVVIFLAIGFTPAWIDWLLTAIWWLYKSDVLMLSAFIGSLVGLILTKIYDREDWQIPSAVVFVPSLIWVFGFVAYHKLIV